MSKNVEVFLVSLLAGPHDGSAANYGDRIYADYAPESPTYPCVVYEIDAEESDVNWSGAEDYAVHGFTVTIFARTKSEAVAAKNYVRTHLHGFYGDSISHGSSNFTGFLYDLQLVTAEALSSYYDDDLQVYVQELDITIRT